MTKKSLFHLMLVGLDAPLIAGLWLTIKHFDNQETFAFVLGVLLMLGSGLAMVFLIRWYKKQQSS